jgi:hypothetical protein
MTTPGFTADATVYRTHRAYAAFSGAGTALTQVIVPQDFPMCTDNKFCLPPMWYHRHICSREDGTTYEANEWTFGCMIGVPFTDVGLDWPWNW